MTTKPTPAPRIPGDPPGFVPILFTPSDTRHVCQGCHFHVDSECKNIFLPCCVGRPGKELVTYMPLSDAIACGAVRQNWSDA